MAKKKNHGAPKNQSSKKQRTDLLPFTFHDLVVENYAPFLPFAHADSHQRYSNGKMSPIGKLSEDPTRLRLAIRTVAKAGITWNGRLPAPYAPASGNEPMFTAAEHEVLSRFPNVEYIYGDVVSLSLSGERVYVLTDAVVQRMLFTRMELPAELLRMPFPSFSFATNSETMVRAILGDARQHHYDKSNSVNHVIRVIGEDPGKTRHLMINTRLMRGRRLQETLSARIELEPGMRVGECLRTFLDLASAFDANDEHVKTHRPGDALDGWFGSSAARLYTMILNVIVYLSSYKPSMDDLKVATPRPMQAGPYTRQAISYQEIGNDLNPIHINAISAFQASSNRPVQKGHALQSRILIPGHWRSWPGEKHLGAAARLVHVEPHWKGPDDAEVRNRPYQVN